MTYREYHNLKDGDTVYYVRFRFLQATIERKKVAVSYYIPGVKRTRSVRVGDRCLYLGQVYDCCFLTLDEASAYLRKVLDEHKVLRVGFRTYPTNAVMVREG